MNLLPEILKRDGQVIVLVTGGRKFSDIWTLHDYLERIEAEADTRGIQLIVLQGGAAGADRLARVWVSHQTGVVLVTEPARWCDISHPDARIKVHPNGRKYDANAGTRRNQLMIDKHPVDVCLAMPGGNGTADMVRRCRAAGIPVVP